MNSRPSRWQRDALPLSYTRKDEFIRLDLSIEGKGVFGQKNCNKKTDSEPKNGGNFDPESAVGNPKNCLVAFICDKNSQAAFQARCNLKLHAIHLIVFK